MLRVNEVACDRDIPFASNYMSMLLFWLVYHLIVLCTMLKFIFIYEPIAILFITFILIMLFNLSATTLKYLRQLDQ